MLGRSLKRGKRAGGGLHEQTATVTTCRPNAGLFRNHLFAVGLALVGEKQSRGVLGRWMSIPFSPAHLKDRYNRLPSAAVARHSSDCHGAGSALLCTSAEDHTAEDQTELLILGCPLTVTKRVHRHHFTALGCSIRSGF